MSNEIPDPAKLNAIPDPAKLAQEIPDPAKLTPSPALQKPAMEGSLEPEDMGSSKPPAAEGFKEHALDALGTILTPFTKGAEWAEEKLFGPALTKTGPSAGEALVSEERIRTLKGQPRTAREEQELASRVVEKADRSEAVKTMEAMKVQPPSKTKGAMTTPLSEDEIYYIAAMHKVNPQVLFNAAPLYSGSVEYKQPQGAVSEITDTLGQLAGFIDSSIGLDAGKAINKNLMDPAERAAVDDMARLIDERRSGVRMGAELAAGVGASLAMAPKVAASGAKAAQQLASAAKGAQLTAAQAQKAAKIGAIAADVADTTFATAVQQGLAAKDGEGFKNAVAGIGMGLGLQAGMMAPSAVKAGAAAIKKPQIAAASAIAKPRSKAEQLFDAAVDEVAPKVDTEYQKFMQQILTRGPIEDKAMAKEINTYLGLSPTKTIVGESESKVVEDSLKRSLLDKEAQEPGSIRKAVQGVLELRQYSQFLDDANAKTQRHGDFFKSLANKISGAKYVASDIDDRLGTHAYEAIDGLSKGQMLLSSRMLSAEEELTPVFSQMRNLGLHDPAKMDAVYAKLTGWNPSPLTPKELELANSLETFLEKQRQTINATGKLNISKLEGERYIPQVPLKGAQRIEAIRNKANEIGVDWVNGVSPKAAPGVDVATFDSVMNMPEGKEFVKVMERLTHTPINDAATFNTVLRKLTDVHEAGEIDGIIEMSASAAHQREGKFPLWIAEKNLANLAHSWVKDTWRVALMKDALLDLRQAAAAAHKAGDSISGDYLERLAQNLTYGASSGTLASATQKARLRWELATKAQANKASNPFTKRLWNGAAALPDLTDKLQHYMYSSFLGFSPRAVGQNVLQTPLMAAPELGNKYGTGLAARNLKKTAADLVGPQAKQRLAWMKQNGYIGEQWNSELMSYLRNGISDSSAVRLTEKALDKAADASMALFQASERMNRLWVLNIADDWVADAMKGDKNALAAIGNMAGGYNRSLREAVAAKDTEKAQDLARRYMLSKTVFNYDRASMSEIGRSLGPLFSMFSKWPTEMTGEALYAARRYGPVKGSLNYAKKYAPTMIGLLVAQQMVDQIASENQKNVTIGKGGLASWHPVGALAGVVKGDAFVPPIAAPAKDVLQGTVAAYQGDVENVMKSVDELLKDTSAIAVPVVPAYTNIVRTLQGLLDEEPMPKNPYGQVKYLAGEE